MVEVLTARGTFEVEPLREPTNESLWVPSAFVGQATPWQMKDEGLCSGELCTPVSTALRKQCIEDGALDIAQLWHGLQRPVLHDRDRTHWVLGESAADRVARMHTLEAPDFALPDLEGRIHRLTDYRGRKVFLTTWAAWCGCRLDLPIWQELQESLASYPFTVIAVALDSRGEKSCRPWIEQAHATYPCLIDRNHLVSDLYQMVNVPQAVWIDEHGRIVRPTEISGASSSRDLAKRRDIRSFYCDAIRDWVRNGTESRFAFDPTRVAEQTPETGENIALAHACFRLAQRLSYLHRRDEAKQLFDRAIELHPESWNFFRQAKNLEHPEASFGPEFHARVASFIADGKRYYPVPDMPGIYEIATRPAQSPDAADSGSD